MMLDFIAAYGSCINLIENACLFERNLPRYRFVFRLHGRIFIIACKAWGCPSEKRILGENLGRSIIYSGRFFESSSFPRAFLSSSFFAALIFLSSVFSLRLPPDKISSKIAGSMEKLSSDFLSVSFLMCVKPVSCRFFLRLTHIFSLRVPSALSAREPSPFEPFRTRTAPHQLKGHQSPQATRACPALFLYLFGFAENIVKRKS